MGGSLAGELSPRGIRVKAVVPGVIETPIWQRTAVPPEADAARERRLQAMIPLNRVGRAEDIASAVLFLASDEAAYIQGIELVIDGGVQPLTRRMPIKPVQVRYGSVKMRNARCEQMFTALPPSTDIPVG